MASSILLPLALAQFIASYAASSMNVAVTDVAKDLNTDVHGVQLAISLFTLVMAALMIPGSKLTDIIGRKRCFQLGLAIYGCGAIAAAFAWNLASLVVGYSILQGVGSALMIPPIYILVTAAFTDLRERARSFGVVSGMAGLGGATGPLIGGLIITAISWRASFGLQAIIVAGIMLLGRTMTEPKRDAKKSRLDIPGAILSGVGLLLLVVATVLAGSYGWGKSKKDFDIAGVTVIPKGGISPVWIVAGIGVGLLVLFYFYIVEVGKRGRREPLVSARLLHNKTSNLGLVTQLGQWLVLQGSFFVISVFLQTERGYSAVQTGLVFLPTIAGLLFSSAIAGRLAARFAQTRLIRGGFVLTILGLVLLLVFAKASGNILLYVPGLLFMGLGIGVMLTASVNVVQSSFGDADQGEISGVSRSASNLGSSLGVALVGSVLVSSTVSNHPFAAALITMMVMAVLGLIAALFLPLEALRKPPPADKEPTGDRSPA